MYPLVNIINNTYRKVSGSSHTLAFQSYLLDSAIRLTDIQKKELERLVYVKSKGNISQYIQDAPEEVLFLLFFFFSFVQALKVERSMPFVFLHAYIKDFVACEFNFARFQIKEDKFYLLHRTQDDKSQLRIWKNLKLSHYDVPVEKVLEHTEAPIRTRLLTAFSRHNISTISDLQAYSVDELKRYRNLGSKSVEVLIRELKKEGIELREKERKRTWY